MDKNSVKKLCIVAHPDDEIIFAGASLIESPEDWHVICVTNGNNPPRKKEFQSAMSYIGCSYEIWGFNDVWQESLDTEGIKQQLHKTFEREWSFVLTHDPVGDVDYEHPHHADVFNCVKNSIPYISRLYCFSYSTVDLTLEYIKKKSRALNFYKTQTAKYGLIYIPLLEDYFYKESYTHYESNNNWN